jgi:hypothetical protein
MRSNSLRVIVGLAVLVVAVVLFVALRDEGSEGEDTSTTPASAGSATTTSAPAGNEAKAKQATPKIVIKGGKPVGGIADLTYNEGDRVRFAVDSDVSDEIHIHGYDLAMDVEAGGSASFNFPADITGIFEVELEQRGEQIAELRVNP